MSGCDTTSALYSQGKRKYLKILAKSTGLQNIVDIFNNPDAAVDDVIKAGLLFLVHLYGFSGKTAPSLNTLRHRCYIKSAFKTSANIAALLPAEDTARYHCLRVYHQVQLWLGNCKKADGWAERKPVEVSRP